MVVGAKAAFTLVTGRRTSVTPARRESPARPTRKREAARKAPGGARGPVSGPAKAARHGELPRSAEEDLARAERALEQARFSDAWQITDRLAREHPSSPQVLRVRAIALSWAGDATEQAVVLHRLHMLRDDPAVRREERAVVGRLVETSPGWLPRIPSPREPVQPASEDVVLYLADESGPRSASGSAARLRANLRAAVGVGLRPEVVTALGFPRAKGLLEFERVDIVDGVPHHRLDLGPHYSLDGPTDRILLDTAWLAARLARRIRPAIIHAIPDDGLGLALVGAALRQHLGLPLLYEGRPAGGPAGRIVPGEESARRAAAVASVMQIADHVITYDIAMRDRIVADGVDPERISIVPGADEAPDHGPRIRDVYARVLSAHVVDGSS